MAIRRNEQGIYYSDKTGKTYTREEVWNIVLQNNKPKPIGEAVGNFLQNNVSGGKVSYEQTGALDNVINDKVGGVNDFSYRVRNLFDANMYEETDADKAARLKEASAILGLDDNDIVRGGLDDNDIMKSALALAKKKQNEPDDWEKFAEEHPATVQYLEQQRNMAVSYDDVNRLGKLEDVITSVKDHIELADIEERRGEIGKALRERNGTYHDLTAGEIAELETLNARREELGAKYQDPWDMYNIIGGIAGMAGDAKFGLGVGAALGGAALVLMAPLAAAGVGVGVGAAALGVFGKGIAGGMAYSGATRNMNTMYLDNAMRQSTNGGYMDATTNEVFSLAYGAASGALYAGGGSRIINQMPGANKIVNAFTKHMPENVINNPTAQKAAWSLYASNLAKIAKSTGEQSVLMGGSVKAAELAARTTAEQMSGLGYDHSNEPGAVDQIVKSTTDFVPTGLTFSMLPVAANAVVNRRTNTPTADAINAVGQAIQETKTADRSPSAIDEALRIQLAGSPAESMRISANDFIAHFQTAEDGKTLTPSEAMRAAQAEAEALGISEAEFREAVDAGGELQFQTADFFKRYYGKPRFQTMGNEVAFGSSAISDKEIAQTQAEMQKAYEDIRAAARDEAIDKDSPEFQMSMQMVRAAYPDMKATDVEAQAKLVHALYTVADKRGVLAANGYKDVLSAMRDVDIRRAESYDKLKADLGTEIENPAFQYVWHGTPHDFDEFSLDHIGSGEGAQAHGYGLYFAGDRAVSEGYRDKLSSGSEPVVEVNGVRFEKLKTGEWATDEGIEDSLHMTQALDRFNEHGDDAIHKIDKEIEELKDFGYEEGDRELDDLLEVKRILQEEEFAEGKAGRLFKVEIPENDVLLDEQKKFSEQPEKVQKALLEVRRTELHYNIGKDEMEVVDTGKVFESVDELQSMTGRQIYAALKSECGGKKEASQALNKVGIEGITYEGGMDGRCYVVFDDNAVDIIEKFNKGKDGEKLGVYLTSDEVKPIIGIFQNANKSTFPHEIMHHMLDLYQKALDGEDVPAEVRADWRHILDYAGVKEGEKMSIEQEEKITSAFEAYLAEGKAPAPELVGVFGRFKRWLKNIYKILRGRGVEVNEEIRGVFDRMLATEQQLAEAEMFYNSAHIMGAKEMGLTELKEYAGLLEKARVESERIMTARINEELKPETQKLIAEARDIAREEEAARLMAEPVYQASALMSTPRNIKDIKKAQAEYRQQRIDEEISVLVLESKQGVVNDRVSGDDINASTAKDLGLDYNDEAFKFQGYRSLNKDWYRQMLQRLGGKLPKAWSKYIDKVRSGDTSAKMPPKMREEYTRIAEERIKEGYSEGQEGYVPADEEFLRITSDMPGADFIASAGGGLKLNAEATRKAYGENAVPKSWTAKDGQFTLDDIAEITGFSSGDALLQEIQGRPTFSKALRDATNKRIAEWKNEHLGSIEDTMREAMANERTMEAIGVEIEAVARLAKEMQSKNEQKTADLMHEGRIKAEATRKAEEKAERDKDKAAGKAERDKDKAVEQAKKETRRLDADVMRGTVRAKAAREYAKKAITEQRVGDLQDANKYLAMSVKAGKQAVNAMSKGEYDIAMQFKNQELLCRAIAHEARKARVEVTKAERFFEKVDKRGLDMKGIDHAFNYQIDRLMDKFNLLRKRKPLEPLDGEDVPLDVFINAITEEYYAPDISREFIDIQPQDYTRLTLAQLRELQNTVRQLQKYGKAVVRLLDGSTESVDSVVNKLAIQIGKFEDKYSAENEIGSPEPKLIEKLAEKVGIKDMPTSIATALTKNETVMRLIDEGEYGVAQKYIEAPIREGERQNTIRNNRSIEAIDRIIAGAGLTHDDLASWRKSETRRHFSFLANDLTAEERVCVALNFGNEGNRDRLRWYFESNEQRKRHGRLDESEQAEVDAKIMQVIGSLDKKQLDFVQGIWAYLDTYKEEIRRHELECSGTDVKMVEATPFKVLADDGNVYEMTGGYYPIRYDGEKSTRAFEQDELNALYKQASTAHAMTEHGHTKERKSSNNEPLKMSLSVLAEHISNVNYDLSMRKAIIDVRRITRNETFRAAFQSRFGNEFLKSLDNWLKYVASDQRESLTFVDKLAKQTRMRMSVAAMGFRVKALMEDAPGNLINACWQMGTAETWRAITEFYSAPMETMTFVNSKSPMMADRMKFTDRDIMDFSRRMLEGETTLDKVRRWSFILDQVADGIINYPMWNHVYAKEIAKGTSEKQAIEIADSWVRQNSMDASRAGAPQLLRAGGEKAKAMAMFYTWYNGLYNRYWLASRMAGHKWAQGDAYEAASIGIRAAVIGFTLPAMWAGTIAVVTSNNRQQDKEKAAKKDAKEFVGAALTYPTGTVPILGSGVKYSLYKAMGLYSGFDASPIEGVARKWLELPNDSLKAMDEEAGRKEVSKVAETGAYLAGVPVRPITIINNIIDWMDNNGDLSIADLVSKRKH